MTGDKIKIEKGVPVPAKRYHSGKWADVIRHMKAGDSFVLPVQTSATVNTLKTSIKSFVKQHDKNLVFVVQKDANGQYRCWRTK